MARQAVKEPEEAEIIVRRIASDIAEYRALGASLRAIQV